MEKEDPVNRGMLYSTLSAKLQVEAMLQQSSVIVGEAIY
jgi:hypothetical protein